MKKYLFILTLILSGTALQAQVRFGFKAGTNASTAKVKTVQGTEPNVNVGVGFHAGAQLKVNLEEQLNFVPQLQYAYKTFSIEYNNLDTGMNTLRFHYVEIPVLIEWKKSLYKSGFFVQFGPSFSIAMNGSQTIEGKTGSSEDNPIKFGFNSYGRFEANLLLNLGYQFGRNFQVTAGYAYGLGTIIDDDNGPMIKPRMFSLSAHYWIQ